MNANVQVVKVFCANCIRQYDSMMTSIEYICNTHIYSICMYMYMYIYIYIYIRDSIQTEQHMVNIILYREHEMKTIINTMITVHIYLCSAVRYELMQTECQGAE